MPNRKLTTTHKLNIALSLFAFGLFVVNQFMVLSGSALDLHGQTGAVILTGFLACGILVQFSKFIEGHRHWFDVIVTVVFLAAHVVAEITIWIRTQILSVGIPEALPLYIVGLYWLVGAFDILLLFFPREVRLFSDGYADPYARISELESELALAQQAQAFAEQSQSERSANVVRLQYERQCERCGKVFAAETKRGAINALAAHRRYCPGVPSTEGRENGNRAIEVAEEEAAFSNGE
jgi:hypothetical protein